MDTIKQLDIKTGDSLLVSGSSWIDKEIKYIEHNNWNHEGKFWWCYGILYVIESDGADVWITKFSDYLSSGKQLLLLKPKWDVDGVEYGKLMLSMVGRVSYNYWNIIAQLLRYVSKGKINWYNKSERYMICSGFGAYIDNYFTGFFPESYKLSPADRFNSDKYIHYEIDRNE